MSTESLSESLSESSVYRMEGHLSYLTTFLHRGISKHLPSCCRQLWRSMQGMGEP